MKRRLIIKLFAALLACPCGALGAKLQETVEAYPSLKGMKILCVKRAFPKAGNRKQSINTLKGLGYPSNHECQSAMPKGVYNNEIGVIDLATGQYTTLHRPEGKFFVGHINLHWDATRFLFTQSDVTSYKVFEMNVDGSGLRQVSQTPDDVDCFEPCYLPGGRIIVNSSAPYQCVPCWHGVDQKFVSNLYVMDADGSNMRRLTFDQDIDFHPSVRHNGQVVYISQDGKQLLAGNLLDLETGTNLTEMRRDVLRLEKLADNEIEDLFEYPAPAEKAMVTVVPTAIILRRR